MFFGVLSYYMLKIAQEYSFKNISEHILGIMASRVQVQFVPRYYVLLFLSWKTRAIGPLSAVWRLATSNSNSNSKQK